MNFDILTRGVLPRDISPGERSFRNEEAKAAYVGVPLAEPSQEGIETLLRQADELSVLELARLTPVIVAAALGQERIDAHLMGLLPDLRLAMLDAGTSAEFEARLLDLFFEEELDAFDAALSELIARTVRIDHNGDVVLTLARIKRLLIRARP